MLDEHTVALVDYLLKSFDNSADLHAFLISKVWPPFKTRDRDRRMEAAALYRRNVKGVKNSGQTEVNTRFVDLNGAAISNGDVTHYANIGARVREISTAQPMTYNKQAKKWEYNT